MANKPENPTTTNPFGHLAIQMYDLPGEYVHIRRSDYTNLHGLVKQAAQNYEQLQAAEDRCGELKASLERLQAKLIEVDEAGAS